MEVVDKIEAEERIGKLAGEQRDDFFTKLVTGKAVTEAVQTDRGRFVIKYPKPEDILKIGKIAAHRRGYHPVEGFDAETEMTNMMASALDVMVVSGPRWFEDAKKLNENFSFLEVPSRAFLAELYGKAYSFREKVERRLGKAAEPDDKRVPPEEGDDGAVDGGAFGGLSSEPHHSAA